MKTTRQQRIIGALEVLRKEAPEFFVEEIMGCCPNDIGLPAVNRRVCGMGDVTAEFSTEYCGKCWQKAMDIEK